MIFWYYTIWLWVVIQMIPDTGIDFLLSIHISNVSRVTIPMNAIYYESATVVDMRNNKILFKQMKARGRDIKIFILTVENWRKNEDAMRCAYRFRFESIVNKDCSRMCSCIACQFYRYLDTRTRRRCFTQGEVDSQCVHLSFL